jgi:AAA domain (dynein-related subfamily)
MSPTINVTEHPVNMATAMVLLMMLLDANDPVMLWGKPGIGKSEGVYQIAGRKAWKVIDFRLNIREPVDMRGIPDLDRATRTTVWFPPDELPKVERDGPEGILFLDEINTASPQMMAVAFGLVLERRVGDYVLPPGWRIVAAGNRVADRAAAQRMPTALRNRFAHLYIEPDVNSWATWATANNVAPEVVAFVRLRRDDVLHVMPRGDENAFPTPRSLTKAAKFVNAPKEYRLRLFAAHVGDAVAAELDGFIELYRSLGDLDDIVRDPDKAPVPQEPSARFAVCTGLARLADRKNFGNIVKYAKRLGHRESEILIVTDCTTRDEGLKNTAVYGSWAVANQDIIVQ